MKMMKLIFFFNCKFNFLERQEVEMVALNETLEEQRAHIQILDSALSNAHGNVQRLEEECRLKEGYAERVKQMTRSLDQLQKGMLSQISTHFLNILQCLQ